MPRADFTYAVPSSAIVDTPSVFVV